MKWSFATIGVVILGLFGVSIILLFQNVTTSNESDYYLLKEVTEAAMIDSIDIPYYRETGDLKIVREKFVENFTRRFAESTILVSGGYTIASYDIMETPPKVSVVIDTNVGTFSVAGNVENYSVQNKLDAILEYVGDKTYVNTGSLYYDNPYVSMTYTKDYYAVISKSSSSSSFTGSYSLKIPGELIAPDKKNVKISNVQFVNNESINTQGKLGVALMNQELSYNGVSTNYMQTINDFSYNVSSVTASYYNCGVSTDIYSCNDTDKYFVTLRGNAGTGKSSVVFKYRITWSYDEYEFAF